MKLGFDPTRWFSERPLLICVAFGCLSVLATLHNKFIFSHHIISSSNMLLLIQNIVTISTLSLMRKLKLLEFEVSMSSAGDWLCGLAYALSVVCGLWSLMFVNVVMFGALKRWTSLVSWAIEWRFTPSETTMKCLPPLFLMMIGTIEASFYDFQFSFVGYTLAFMSCLAQGAAYELGRRVARRNKGVCAVLYSNSVVALMVLSVLVLITGDLWRSLAGTSSSSAALAAHHHNVVASAAASTIAPIDPPAGKPHATASKSHEHTYSLIATSFHLCINAMTCLFMNYFIFLNCFVNSPLAHSVTGNMKVVMTTLIGGIMFGFSLDFFGAIGLAMNMASGFWFSAIKLKAKVDAKKRSKSLDPSDFRVGSIHPQHSHKTTYSGSGGGGNIYGSSNSINISPSGIGGSNSYNNAPTDAPPRIVSTFGSASTLQKKLSDHAINLSVAESYSRGGGGGGGSNTHNALSGHMNGSNSSYSLAMGGNAANSTINNSAASPSYAHASHNGVAGGAVGIYGMGTPQTPATTTTPLPARSGIVSSSPPTGTNSFGVINATTPHRQAQFTTVGTPNAQTISNPSKATPLASFPAPPALPQMPSLGATGGGASASRNTRW